jgi:phage terminase small subunit
MGKRSAASLSIISGSFSQLPQPPDHLTPSQAQIWAAVVATKPHDWFQADSFPVLSDYCRAIDMDNEMADAVNGYDRAALTGFEGLQTWKALIKMQRDQQKHVAMLATKLRLTPQSRYNAKSASTASNRAGLERPWGSNRVLQHDPATTQTG